MWVDPSAEFILTKEGPRTGMLTTLRQPGRNFPAFTNEAPRAYARGIIKCFGGIRRSNSPSFALRATEDPSNAFIPGLTFVVFCVGG
jgi:hypothetical protein